MNIGLAKYTCASCAACFDAPALGENAYGEFLLWSKSGSCAYLNAFTDIAYKEVEHLLSLHPRTHYLSAMERASVLRAVYGGLACDLDHKNEIFEMDSAPVCPVCGSKKMASWVLKTPFQSVEADVHLVTHTRWLALSKLEKNDLLDAYLERNANAMGHFRRT